MHKFGGSSLKGKEGIERVATIINKLPTIHQSEGTVIVLSALSGVTDKLLNLIVHAKDNDEAYKNNLNELQVQHNEILKSLISGSSTVSLKEEIDEDFNNLSKILHTVYLTKSSSKEIEDLVSGLGEIWSTKIMTGLLKQMGHSAIWLDARKVIITEHLLTGPSIDWEASKENLYTYLDSDPGSLIVIPGFVASTKDGIATTLRRNGSDLTATVFGILLNASAIEIWKDVDGLYSADPRRVPEAVMLDRISYMEALELAYYGATVLHPSSIAPAIKGGIPITIRSTLKPEHSGTKIHGLPDVSSNQTMVKGFATIDSIALITLEGSGMIGVPGISKTLFQALSEAHISVMMISQASSEYSISVAVTESDGRKAKIEVEKAFRLEIEQGHVQSVKLEEGLGILAAVGDQMVHQPGIAAIFFNGLSRSRINVRMISQGSSERNISVILASRDMTRALRAVHSAFYLSHLTLSVGIIGIGLIGSSLLGQIQKQQAILKNQFNIDLRIKGLSNSTSMLLQSEIDLNSWKILFNNESIPTDISTFLDYIQTDSIPHSVIIDCSSSQLISKQYESWLNRGVHIITPNKKANSGNYSYYQSLQNYIKKGPSTNPLEKTTHYFYETTVGAGLPIISTLRDLIKTGDRIVEIEGVLSGTLSFIFNTLTKDNSFSEVVIAAKEAGYTEPDPRDDLSGMDVARKLIILAREIGLPTNLEDVKIKSFLPESLFGDSGVEEFLSRLADYDSQMKTRIVEAESKDEVLRYVGVVRASGECFVELMAYPKQHPFANLSGSENVILFKTSRYSTYPLIVQGPGAGAAVTSAGVFAELLRLADLLGSS